ncbi:2713_t:CDS:2 [Funneliformis geosporum]|uniref:15492_t:CDS:1 n=1 Tax=Funneliformis geosporum TaxID=1117311 RepID=A0A9W4SI55_9GLOM|nr:2713_t:CDS:2 [Funneliformis geosporum]CAI2170628.1 15492_t:CDS:2 [Funneliformis geosporum]
MSPLPYRIVRFLFQISSNAFYAVEVDGIENIPPDGCPTILCPNHSNSLTDSILLLSSVPPEKRDMSVGTVPIKRAKDYNNAKVDNTSSFEVLIDTLEKGNCICLFPEGISRYHSQIANFKPGILTRNKDKEDFSVNLLTVSIVYNHREKFRSNVLVQFNPPIVLTPKHQNLLKTITEDGRRRSSEQAINELTNAMEEMVRSNTLDSPDWQTLRIAHTARKLYAGELGTRISFSEYVKLTKKFIDLLSKVKNVENDIVEGSSNNIPNGTSILDEKEFIVERIDSGNLLSVDNPDIQNEKISHQGVDLADLSRDLTAYQDLLDSRGIKDYRFSNPTPLSKPALIFRIYLRVIWASVLASLSLPGWALWSPVFVAVKFKEYQIRKLPIAENLDEIAQYKLLISAILLIPIYLIACFFTLPFILITSWLIPLLMWLTIRWTEDLFQAMRSCISLTKLLFLPLSEYSEIRSIRENIRMRVQELAVHELGLPENPENLISKSRPRGMGYFSIRRRRKKDYNEVLRLWDVSAYE